MTFKHIFPTDDWKIILELSDSSLWLLNYRDLKDDYSFCAYPNQLKAFTFTDRTIIWKNGTSLDLQTAIGAAKPVDLDQVKGVYLTVGMKNQAPTAEDTRHHVYYAMLKPFDAEQPICIGESIGGGHAERGGERYCSIEELMALDDWKHHFELADCGWAVEIIEQNKPETGKIVQLIAEGIRIRSDFNEKNPK